MRRNVSVFAGPRRDPWSDLLNPVELHHMLGNTLHLRDVLNPIVGIKNREQAIHPTEIFLAVISSDQRGRDAFALGHRRIRPERILYAGLR